jgi:hypothetical protein
VRLVHLHGGELQVRWTWLPCWMALNPKTKEVVGREMRDLALLNGLTTRDEDLDRLHDWVRDRFCGLFPAFSGLGEYLDALSAVGQAESASESA